MIGPIWLRLYSVFSDAVARDEAYLRTKARGPRRTAAERGEAEAPQTARAVLGAAIAAGATAVLPAAANAAPTLSAVGRRVLDLWRRRSTLLAICASLDEAIGDVEGPELERLEDRSQDATDAIIYIDDELLMHMEASSILALGATILTEPPDGRGTIQDAIKFATIAAIRPSSPAPSPRRPIASWLRRRPRDRRAWRRGMADLSFAAAANTSRGENCKRKQKRFLIGALVSRHAGQRLIPTLCSPLAAPASVRSCRSVRRASPCRSISRATA